MKLSTLLKSLCFVPTVLGAFDLNRAGAVLKAPEGDSFTSVTGTFTVPNLTGNNKLSIWIAIGDSLNQDIVLKGGITYANGLKSWAAWFPAPETDITSTVPVRSGDSITVTVSTAAGSTGGTVVVENKTQNRRTTQTITAPADFDPSRLNALAADWFVQAYQTAGELVQVPRFQTVTFTACSATLASGGTVALTSAGVYEIQGTSGQIYSRTTTTANGVTVRQQ
ncbi:concanavalin A-like lectin/glucanase [Patellaria atrata CBS 101060]|uniref:Concanavalin A-like lectin/glucanase n=1 Tax=Patellaria atrata CBS 101060 TaxID=1346257 RepID=A0A9P4VU99_9PEZI|nr:concanavalin A-like lectin/glucanase [Patellaria atrata CBS 101060]